MAEDRLKRIEEQLATLNGGLDGIEEQLTTLATNLNAAVIRLPASLKPAFAGSRQALVHPGPMAPAMDGFVWETAIDQDRLSVRLATRSGATIHQWTAPIRWTPDVEVPGTAEWWRTHGR